MIARIGDEEGNFSHLAIVGEDARGEKYIVEALIQYGTIVTPLEKWREQQDARVALYRLPDQSLAQKAARIIYDKAQEALDQKKGIKYDFAMDDDDYSSLFCSEVIRYAYDLASEGKVIVPKFRSTVAKFKDSKYPRSLGVTKTSLFAPFDVEVDPRFNFVAEYRYYPLLRQVRMQDAVLQSIYSWISNKNYEFHWSPEHTVKAYVAKLVRQFGVAADKLPTYMPLKSIKTNLQFETVALALEKNIYEKEEELYKKNGYLPSAQDFLEINEEYRKNDCAERAKWMRKNNVSKDQSIVDNLSKFHYFFYSKDHTCE